MPNPRNISDELLAAKIRYEMSRCPLSFATWHPGQDPVLRDNRRQVGLITGNWFGKSYLAGMLISAIAEGHTLIAENPMPKAPSTIWVFSDPRVFSTVLQPVTRSFLPQGEIVGHSRISQWNADSLWTLRNGSVIEWMSYDTPVGSVEGPTIEAIFRDEPGESGSQLLIDRARSRLRSNKFCREYDFFTPLAAAFGLYDEWETNPNPQLRGLHKGAIWANCACLAGLPVDKLRRMGKDQSLATAKHLDGCRCNGGYKTRKEIEEYMQLWARSESDAREWGEWLFVHRRILPAFTRDKHMLRKEWMLQHWGGVFPKRGSLYVSLDPHGARPDFCQIWVALPDEWECCIAELPGFYDGAHKGRRFQDIREVPETRRTCEALIAMLKTINLPIAEMVMDPRAGGSTARDWDKQRIVDRFNEELKNLKWTASRFRQVNSAVDNVTSVEGGHRKINDALGVVNRFTALPVQMVSEMCENTIYAAENFRTKPDLKDESKTIREEPEEKMKDPIDCWRYKDMSRPRYTPHDEDVVLGAGLGVKDYGLPKSVTNPGEINFAA